MEGAILPRCNCNDDGKRYLEKYWCFKSRIYYNDKELGQFIKDCPLTRRDRISQLVESSAINGHNGNKDFG